MNDTEVVQQAAELASLAEYYTTIGFDRLSKIVQAAAVTITELAAIIRKNNLVDNKSEESGESNQ